MPVVKPDPGNEALPVADITVQDVLDAAHRFNSVGLDAIIETCTALSVKAKVYERAEYLRGVKRERDELAASLRAQNAKMLQLDAELGKNA